jgi:Tfp pilus assembly protein FimT
MEDIVIPGWIIYIIPGVIAWLLWLTLQTRKNEIDIAVNTANDRAISNELLKITSAIEKMEIRFTQSMESLGRRIDLFMKNENDFLKAETEFLKSISRGKV